MNFISNTIDFKLSRELMDIVVETNDKQRFAITPEGTKIRANQGHSICIDLDLEPQKPPLVLFHGTAERFMGGIKKEGLNKQNRHHVHLTESVAVAKAVGSRYGKIVLLEIDADAMNKKGYKFFKTANNVWLVDSVPYNFISGR